MNELKQIIKDMNAKVKQVESEKDLLQNEMKEINQ